jgi:hypothetical protein
VGSVFSQVCGPGPSAALPLARRGFPAASLGAPRSRPLLAAGFLAVSRLVRPVPLLLLPPVAVVFAADRPARLLLARPCPCLRPCRVWGGGRGLGSVPRALFPFRGPTFWLWRRQTLVRGGIFFFVLWRHWYVETFVCFVETDVLVQSPAAATVIYFCYGASQVCRFSPAPASHMVSQESAGACARIACFSEAHIFSVRSAWAILQAM